MPQACRICNNPQRLEIDRELAQGKNKSEIVRRFGVPYSSLDYHARHHLSRQIMESYERKGRLVSDELVSQFEGLFVMAKGMYDKSLARDSISGDANAIRSLSEMRAVLDTMCRVLALLVEAKALEQQGPATESQMDLSRLTLEEIEQLEYLLGKAGVAEDLLELPPATPSPDFSAALEWTPAPPRPGTPLRTDSKPVYAVEDPDPSPTPELEPRPEKPKGLPPQHCTEIEEASREEQRRFVSELRGGGVRRL